MEDGVPPRLVEELNWWAHSCPHCWPQIHRNVAPLLALHKGECIQGVACLRLRQRCNMRTCHPIIMNALVPSSCAAASLPATDAGGAAASFLPASCPLVHVTYPCVCWTPHGASQLPALSSLSVPQQLAHVTISEYLYSFTTAWLQSGGGT
jgi:hypothetical protein